MKTHPISLLSLLIMFAMVGPKAFTQTSEQVDATPPLRLEINGRQIATEGVTGTITIRTDGDAIEIDTDGDGEAEEHIEKLAEAREMAWLGIKTMEIAPELASQLELEGGAVIEMVLPDSPAEKAGLKDYDIITAVGKTPIGTPGELSAAIRSMSPGSAVGISVIRKSVPTNLVATLGTRPEMPQVDAEDTPGFDFGADFGGDADEIRERIERIQQEMLKGMKLRLDGTDLPNLGKGADIVRMSSKTTSFSDGDGSITITMKNGATHIEAKDAEGKLLYKGPAETEDDRKQLPPKVLEKLERFEEMNLDIEIEGFEDKLLPPALELPELQPAKPKQPAGGGKA